MDLDKYDLKKGTTSLVITESMAYERLKSLIPKDYK